MRRQEVAPTSGTTCRISSTETPQGRLCEPADQGNTVVVIEHNLEVIKTADWILDLGPEGGDGGGELVALGRPEDVVREKRSYTGQFLKELLERRPGARKAEPAE